MSQYSLKQMWQRKKRGHKNFTTAVRFQSATLHFWSTTECSDMTEHSPVLPSLPPKRESRVVRNHTSYPACNVQQLLSFKCSWDYNISVARATFHFAHLKHRKPPRTWVVLINCWRAALHWLTVQVTKGIRSGGRRFHCRQVSVLQATNIAWRHLCNSSGSSQVLRFKYPFKNNPLEFSIKQELTLVWEPLSPNKYLR